MKLLTTIFLVFISSLGFSQNQAYRSKLTLSPNFGIGWAIPPFINAGNSNLILKPNYLKNNIIGVIGTSSGQNKQVYKITNTIGLDANYSFSKQWSANIGVSRVMQINLLKDPEPVRISNTLEYSTWIFAYKYTSLTFGAKYQIYDRFFQCNIHYAGKVKEAIEENNNGTGGGVTTNGNGLTTSILSQNNHTIIISPEYGIIGVSSFDLPMELSVGMHIPTSIFSQQRATFIRNNSNAGENILKFTQAALWLRVRVPITIWRKPQKPIRETQPKTKVENLQPQKTMEFGGKEIIKGEKVVLKSLQFEQAKAILSPIAMSELDRVYQLMSQSSTMIIEIIGHTSDEGDRNSNIELSLNRSKACKEYLIKKGIKPNRIQVRGMGPDSPISKGDKSQNRRVEMQILRI